jgi:hypothetical protein
VKLSLDARTFPIQRPWERSRMIACPSSIPWSLIEPHAKQAQRNHDQTLERLAERGGLSPSEAIAVLADRQWTSIELTESVRQLTALVDSWQTRAEGFDEALAARSDT